MHPPHTRMPPRARPCAAPSRTLFLLALTLAVARQVMQDNPEMVKQGLNFVAANPGLVAGSSGAAPSASPAASDRPPAYSSQDTV